MSLDTVVGDVPVSHIDNHVHPITLALAVVAFIWSTAVTLVCITGSVQLRRHYSKPLKHVVLDDDAPDVTIIRPIKGLEPCLYDCLASTFYQLYPTSKLHIRFCISDRSESALPILERLLRDFPDRDAQILVESEDDLLNDDHGTLGPNPKIRNMSRAYREAIGNLIWIIDCNVWVAKGTLGRMVKTLDGHGEVPKNKFVHQLPLVVDTIGSTIADEVRGPLNGTPGMGGQIRTTSTATHDKNTLSTYDRSWHSVGGGRLEEIFMSSSHAKFYTAINTVLIAPCIVGKSTMFRRSHLDSLTQGQGIDFFSENICEDHLIGDLLWRKRVPEEKRGEKWGKHALCFGDLAIQPMANMSVREYWSRRVRWLRVRKFTVFMATLVEPGTESFLCSLYTAFAWTTLPALHDTFGIPQTWSAFALIWLLSVIIWCFADRQQYKLLHSAASIAVDENTPAFARGPSPGKRRVFSEWILAWLGRESLALPVWVWAFYGGTTVEWRGKKFWVGLDMKVHEIHEKRI